MQRGHVFEVGVIRCSQYCDVMPEYFRWDMALENGGKNGLAVAQECA